MTSTRIFSNQVLNSIRRNACTNFVIHNKSAPKARFSILSAISDDLLISTSMGHTMDNCKSYEEVVDRLVKSNIIKSKRLEDAFRKVDRSIFVPLTDNPYQNRPIPIGYNATISTFQQHAQVLQELENCLSEGGNALDIGCGSGFLTAVMAYMVSPSGKVTGIDIVPQLIQLAISNINQLDPSLIMENHINLISGNALAFLFNSDIDIQYDCIHCAVAIKNIEIGMKLAKQRLLPKGSLLIPIGEGGQEQQLIKITKTAGNQDLNITKIMNVLCQPLLEDISGLKPLSEREATAKDYQSKLFQWKSNFEQATGRKATKLDIDSDPIASDLFQAFTTSRKVWYTKD